MTRRRQNSAKKKCYLFKNKSPLIILSSELDRNSIGLYKALYRKPFIGTHKLPDLSFLADRSRSGFQKIKSQIERLRCYGPLLLVHQPYFQRLGNHARFQDHFTLDKTIMLSCGLCYGTERLVQLEVDRHLLATITSSQQVDLHISSPHQPYSNVPRCKSHIASIAYHIFHCINDSMIKCNYLSLLLSKFQSNRIKHI